MGARGFANQRGWLRRSLRNGRSAWGPGSPDDSLIVGARQTDSPGLGVFEQTRMFFDKATGAFRAGSTTGTQWDTLATTSTAFGSNNSAAATDSFASGTGQVISSAATQAAAFGNANSVTAVGGFTAGAGNTVATNNYGSAFGQSNSVTGFANFAAGYQNTVTGNSNAGNAAIGYGNSSTGNCALATGNFSSATRSYQRSHAAGQFAAAGDAQMTRFVSRVSTSNGTATELGLDGSTAYITIANTRTMSFHIKIAAHRTDVSGTAAAWPQIFGAITRDSSGNCRLLGSVTGAGTTTLSDAGGATWSVAVTADSANNRLAITVTGEAAKTIRWVAVTEMAEVG